MDGMDVILMEERGGEGWMIVMNGGRLSLGFCVEHRNQQASYRTITKKNKR